MLFVSPVPIFVFLLGLAVYYYIFTYIEAASFFMLTASIWLIYALIISSALLLTVGIYSIRKLFARAKVNAGAVPMSAVTAVLGSMMSCGCSYSLFGPLVGALGISSAEVASINGFELLYGNYIVALFAVANLAFLTYAIRRIWSA